MTSRTLSTGIVASMTVAALAPVVSTAQAADPPQTATIVVYYDLDNDGRRDAGEPGVPGQALSSEGGAVTDDAGRAVVDVGDPQPNNPSTVRLSTGWFRSGCTAVNCDADTRRGRQNDFAVKNQFIKLADAEVGGTYHVGIVPDWPGGYDEMPANFGWTDDGDEVFEPGEAAGSINEVDVSTRLSWRVPPAAECNRTGNTAHRACRPGDEPQLQFQVMNEGTVVVTGVSGMLEMPFEAPIDAVATTSPLNDPGLELTFGAYDTVAGAFPWTIDGEMGVGSVAQFLVTTEVPDVVRPTPEPSEWDHVLVNRITAVDQWTGTNDVDSAQCSTGAARSCDAKVGKHNKQSGAADDVDDIAFSVVEVAAGNEVDDVHDLALVLSATTERAVEPGALVSFVAEVTNQGTRNVRNVSVAVHPPAGLSFSPGDNPAWTADATTVLQGQLAAGATVSVAVELRVDADATSALNGTAALRGLAEIVHVLDAESATFVPRDIDSTPDLDPSNDGYDVIDPWDPSGDGVITDGASTVGTSAGGEDDQDPAGIAITDDRAVCVRSSWGSDVSLTFSGDRGANANVLRNGDWLATVSGSDRYVDIQALPGSTYTLRVRDAGVTTDIECRLGDLRTNPPECVGTRLDDAVVLSFSGAPGTNANLLRNGEWLALVSTSSRFVDESAPADATYLLRVREDGAIVDAACAID